MADDIKVNPSGKPGAVRVLTDPYIEDDKTIHVPVYKQGFSEEGLEPVLVSPTNPLPIASPPGVALITSNFLIEVAKGNVAGHTSRRITGRTAEAGVVEKDIWGAPGSMIYPVIEESWEIVSTSASDTSGGTGANTVLVNYLDGDYIERSASVSLNGTTPVSINSDHYRPNGAFVILSGSSMRNQGQITIRQIGSGNIRQVIAQFISASEDSYISTPAGKSAATVRSVFNFAKDKDGVISVNLMLNGTNTWVKSRQFPVYQNNIPFDLTGEFFVPEKADFVYSVTASNEDTEVISVLTLIFVDNDVVNLG